MFLSKSGLVVKLIILLLLLSVVLGIVGILLLHGELPFGKITSSPSSSSQQTPENVSSSLINVGTPNSDVGVEEDEAVDILTNQSLFSKGAVAYVLCRPLTSGDRISAMGGDKYSVVGPVWFVYIDEEPYSFFEHDVKYAFVDASTGEVISYDESWPPTINGKSISEAAESCGGVTEIYAS